MTAPSTSETIAAEAGLWVIRARDPDFTDWDGFTMWLEADPAHLAAYDRAVDDDDWATEVLADASAGEAAAANDDMAWDAPAARDEGSRGRPGWWGAGAIAASLVLAAGGSWYAMRDDAARSYETAPGQRRTVELADGSRIQLNGSTRIEVAQDDPRQVTLRGGEVLFEVRHDAARPFVVTVGDTRLVDAGTVFNVIDAKVTLDVAVASGAVIYNGKQQEEIRLQAGDALARNGADGKPVLRRAAVDEIGSWRSGYLHYDSANLAQVGGDLARNLGLSLIVDERVARHSFSGTLSLKGGPDVVFPRIAPVLGVRIVKRDNGWVMLPGDD